MQPAKVFDQRITLAPEPRVRVVGRNFYLGDAVGLSQTVVNHLSALPKTVST